MLYPSINLTIVEYNAMLADGQKINYVLSFYNIRSGLTCLILLFLYVSFECSVFMDVHQPFFGSLMDPAFQFICQNIISEIHY